MVSLDYKLLEGLLHEAEGTALDFKSSQYPFENATEAEKSELLKDILAFANSWRRTTKVDPIIKTARGLN